jgi:tRNA(fMet)-specific endonuclease VapC
MMHLDTNVAIALLNNRQPLIRLRFDAARAAGTSLFLSMIVYHELMYGAANSARPGANQDKIALFIASGRLTLLPFEESDAREAADIRAYLKKVATPIGPYDVLIAAQSRRARATLVTANTREFERVPGLSVIDWADNTAKG